jgi:hypothetical protein
VTTAKVQKCDGCGTERDGAVYIGDDWLRLESPGQLRLNGLDFCSWQCAADCTKRIAEQHGQGDAG